MMIPPIGIGSLGTSIGGLGTSLPSPNVSAASGGNGQNFGDALTKALG